MFAAALAVHPTSVQQPEQVQLAQALLRSVQGREQSSGQLGRCHDLMVVEPAQDDVVAVGELAKPCARAYATA